MNSTNGSGIRLYTGRDGVITPYDGIEMNVHEDTRYHRLDPEVNPATKRMIESIVGIVRTWKKTSNRIISSEMIIDYYEIGRIIDRASKEGLWGDRPIDYAVGVIRESFPEMKNVDRANMFNMKRFYRSFPDRLFVCQYVSRLSWTNINVITTLKSYDYRKEMVKRCLDGKWSTRILKEHITPEEPEIKCVQNSVEGINEEMSLIRTMKVHLRLKHSQKHLLQKYIEKCSELFDILADHALIYYFEHGLVLFRNELNQQITSIKRHTRSFDGIPEVCLQNVSARVHTFMSNFADDSRNGGAAYPCSRSCKNYNSITYDQPTTIRIQNGRLWLGSFPSLIKMSNHAPLSDIRSCTIIRQNTGKWYASIVYRKARVKTESTVERTAIGIDLGLYHRAILSDGSVQEISDLSHLERRCDEIRSKRDKRQDDPVFLGKCNRILAKVQDKINNKRNYELHCQTKDIVSNHS